MQAMGMGHLSENLIVCATMLKFMQRHVSHGYCEKWITEKQERDRNMTNRESMVNEDHEEFSTS